MLAAAAWFFAFVVVHIICLRAGFGGARSLLLGYAASVAGMLITVIGLTAGLNDLHAIILGVIISVFASACLFVTYVPAVYIILTSLSVQTMILLSRSEGTLDEAKLYERFAGRAIVEGRLATLLASGYIVAEGTRYRLTSRGRAVAGSFAVIKDLWRLGAGG